jgi:hypothetical protein
MALTDRPLIAVKPYCPQCARGATWERLLPEDRDAPGPQQRYHVSCTYCGWAGVSRRYVELPQ